MRTGTVATIDNRNWELRDQSGPVQRLSQSRAICPGHGKRHDCRQWFPDFRVPYGTLLCVSDKPLHGELKLPGMASSFLQNTSRAASTDRDSRHGIACVTCRWSVFTAGNCAASAKRRFCNHRSIFGPPIARTHGFLAFFLWKRCFCGVQGIVTNPQNKARCASQNSSQRCEQGRQTYAGETNDRETDDQNPACRCPGRRDGRRQENRKCRAGRDFRAGHARGCGRWCCPPLPGIGKVNVPRPPRASGPEPRHGRDHDQGSRPRRKGDRSPRH